MRRAKQVERERRRKKKAKKKKEGKGKQMDEEEEDGWWLIGDEGERWTMNYEGWTTKEWRGEGMKAIITLV